MIEMWIAHGGPIGMGISAACKVTGPDESEHPVKWRGPVAAIYRQKWKDSGRDANNPYHCEQEMVAYLTLQDVKRLLVAMEPLAGKADEPLPPPISGPERESYKIQEGPNV